MEPMHEAGKRLNDSAAAATGGPANSPGGTEEPFGWDPIRHPARPDGSPKGSESATPEPVLLALRPWQSFAGLVAGFSTRLGGVGQAPWDSLNTALHVGDDPADVVRNRQRIAERLGWPFEAWTCAEQVHGDKVWRVTSADRGKGRLRREDAVAEADALITDVPGVLLVMYFADCVPLFFYDPETPAIGLAHAGWKGTALDIAGKTVRAMAEAFGSRPERLYAAVGPSIGPCCYEVDEPVLARLLPLAERLRGEGVAGEDAGGGREADQTAGGAPAADTVLVKSTRAGHAAVNLKEFNRRLMMKAGILPSRIELSTWCTACRDGLFFSHRREKGKTGRMAAFLGIKR